MKINSIEYAIEEASKFTYSIGKFALTYFYHSSDISNLKKGFDVFLSERFEQRLEEFSIAQKKLSNEQKKEFYNDLKYNKQNINFLFDFVEKSRTTSFEIHVKILAMLSVNFIINKNLNYHEICLISNINSFNEIDFKVLYELFKKNPLPEKAFLDGVFYTNDMKELIAIKKFLNAGILSESKITNLGHVKDKGLPVNFTTNEFSRDLYKILDYVFK